jgi:hypothetical protein
VFLFVHRHHVRVRSHSRIRRENDYIHGGRGNVRDVHDVRECRGGYDVRENNSSLDDYVHVRGHA